VSRIVWTARSTASDFAPWSLTQAPDGPLWAAEGLGDRFTIFTADGQFVGPWGESGRGDGQFDFTRANGDAYGNVAFGPDGTFYVLDVGNRRIQRFDKDRTFLSAWGTFGRSPGQFVDPVGLAFDADGNLNVLDDGRGVVETYSPAGKVVRTIAAFPGQATPNNGANRLSIGPNGHLYISLIVPNEVIELDRGGRLMSTFGGPGSGAGAFAEQPGAMAFDAAGRLYVTGGPERGDAPGVTVFAPDGRYLGGFGALGSGDGDIAFPTGIVVAPDGIYVADVGGLPDFGYRSLIRKFEPVDFP
jgi:sugar lactone lactonase YvrE